MTDDDFRQLVAEMRNAQREYFKTRASDWLTAAKKLEKQVDDELRPSKAPTLFD
jgi:hypothetical protein